MRVLGLSGMHPDASAALLVDGELVAFVREANTSGVPHDAGLPLRAARVALDLAGVASSDLDTVVFHEKPLRRFERTLVTTLARFPAGGRAFATEVARWLGDRLWIRGRLASELGVAAQRVHFAEHLRAHAAVALGAARSVEGAADELWAWLVLDDVGEWAGCAFGRGVPADCTVELLRERHAPATEGLVQGAAAAYLGLDRWHQADRLQDLATHGEPRFLDALEAAAPTDADGALGQLTGFVEEAGGLALDPAYWSPIVGAPRTPGAPVDPAVDRTGADLAASVERWLERRALDLARRALAASGSRRLALGGVLARRRRVVDRLARELELEDLVVAPLPGDDGTALGAAWLGAEATGRALRGTLPGGVPLRPEPESAAVGSSALPDSSARPVDFDHLARVLQKGEPVGWVRGRAPAADMGQLARLVLADARDVEASRRLVRRLALGPEWLALRTLVPAEDLPRWLRGGTGLARVAATLGVHLDASELTRLVPGACAVDGSLWLQTVCAHEEPELHDLLRAHGRATGTAALLAATLLRADRAVPLGVGEARECAVRLGLAELCLLDDGSKGATQRSKRASGATPALAVGGAGEEVASADRAEDAKA